MKKTIKLSELKKYIENQVQTKLNESHTITDLKYMEKIAGIGFTLTIYTDYEDLSNKQDMLNWLIKNISKYENYKINGNIIEFNIENSQDIITDIKNLKNKNII